MNCSEAISPLLIFTRLSMDNEISENTLKTIYSSIKHMEAGYVGDTIDLDEVRKYIDDEDGDNQ